MGLTVTEDTPADMLAGNMELLVQLPPRMDEDYENDDIYEGDEALRQHHRNHHRHHNHHHNSGHHPRRTVNGNARRVTVARSTPMMDLLVQVATSQKLSASSYTLEAIGEHGLVLTHHPNTPIGALDALQVKLLPKQGTFAPSKTRHVNQPFEQTFRLQVHLPRNQLYVSRVSSRMNLGKILDEVCREKNLDRNNYELCHPANIEETLDLSLSLQDYHLQEVTLCPKRRSMGSSLSSQDIMALQRQEERRRQEAKQSVFGFAFKKSKESSLSTDSLGERSVSPARSDGTGRSASPQAPTAPTRPQRKRRPAPKPPMPRAEPEPNPNPNPNPKGGLKETERESENPERMMVISHSRNSSDSSGYHEASVLSDNLDNNIRVPETLPRRTRLQGTTTQESPGRTLAESSQASKSLGNLAAVPAQRATIARGTSNLSLSSAGLRKKKAAPAPPPPRPLSSAISTQGLERIVDSEESLSSISESSGAKASSDIGVASKRKLIVVPPRASFGSEENDGLPKTETRFEEKIDARKSAKNSPDPEASPTEDPSISSPEIPDIEIVPNVEPAREPKRGSTDDAVPLSTEPITKAEETTSDLLKKVSDTLSGSLRSPGTGTVAATSSLANEHQPINDAHCVAEAKTRVNEPQQIPEAKENTVNCTAEDPKNNERSSIDPIDTNFLDNRQPLAAIGESTYSTTSDHLQNTGQQDPDSSSTTTDWQYLLPEPPTAFRDTNVEENRQIFSSIPSSKDPSISEDIAKSKLGKSVKSKEIETVLTNGSTPAPNIRYENGGARSRTVSGSSSDLGNESTIDRRRLSRLGIKSDSDSRRGSQASSTPTIAPVDNTLSNFVITTYSRPKNVDIFNEIEEKAREPQHQQQSRKNSGQNGSIFESRKSSTASVRKDETVQQKFGNLIVEKSREQEVTPRNNESISSDRNDALELGDRNLYNTVNRSNIKISIATKPRPRGDSISDNQRPKPVVVTIGSDENTSNSRENCHFGDENNSRESILTGGNNKFSQWREHVVNKQETPNPDKQLQSLQVLRSILPQLDSTARISNDSNITEKANSNPSEETRVSPAPIPSTENTSTEPSTQQTLSVSSSNEMPTKRYSYAGPPAINLGSWSDRSSTTRIQIKPDSDYKVENSRSSSEAPSSKKENHYTAVSRTAINSTPDKNSQTIDKAEKKEPNELAKNLIVRNTASGFKRPVSMIVESSGTTMTRLKKEFEDVSQRIVANGEKDTQKKFNGGDYAREQIPQSARKEEGNDEVDARPRNFKELKETFAKDQKSNTLSMPKYGTYGRRVDNSGMKSTSLRRDSSLSSNGDHQQVENARVDNKIVANSAQEKKNSVTSLQNNRNGVQDAVRRTSRGVLMPVVKGFKVAVANEDEATANFSQEKRSGYRVAIGDISNGNYIPNQNGLRKTTQVKVAEEFSSNVPKPPPTMPVITGVTLKSTNHANARPKSMPVQLDTRDQLLESIRSFGQNQLRRVPRKNTNMTGGGPAGSRMVRS